MVPWKASFFLLLAFSFLSQLLPASFIHSSRQYCSHFSHENLSEKLFEEMGAYLQDEAVIRSAEIFLQRSKEMNEESSLLMTKKYISFLFLAFHPDYVLSGNSDEQKQEEVMASIQGFYTSHKNFCAFISSLDQSVIDSDLLKDRRPLHEELMEKARTLNEQMKGLQKGKQILEDLGEAYIKIHRAYLRDLQDALRNQSVKSVESFLGPIQGYLSQIKTIEKRVKLLYGNKGENFLKKLKFKFQRSRSVLEKLNFRVLKKFSKNVFGIDLAGLDSDYKKREILEKVKESEEKGEILDSKVIFNLLKFKFLKALIIKPRVSESIEAVFSEQAFLDLKNDFKYPAAEAWFRATLAKIEGWSGDSVKSYTETLKGLKKYEEKAKKLEKTKKSKKINPESLRTEEERKKCFQDIALYFETKLDEIHERFFEFNRHRDSLKIQLFLEKSLFQMALKKASIGLVRTQKFIESFWLKAREFSLDSRDFFSPAAFEALLVKSFSRLHLGDDPFLEESPVQGEDSEREIEFNFKVACRGVYEQFLKERGFFSESLEGASLADLSAKGAFVEKYRRIFSDQLEAYDFTQDTHFLSSSLFESLEAELAQDSLDPLSAKEKKLLEDNLVRAFEDKDQFDFSYSMKGLPEIFLYRKDEIKSLRDDFRRVALKSLYLEMFKKIFKEEGLDYLERNESHLVSQFDSLYKQEKEDKFPEESLSHVFSEVHGKQNRVIPSERQQAIVKSLKLVPTFKPLLKMIEQDLKNHVDMYIRSGKLRTEKREKIGRFSKKDLTALVNRCIFLVKAEVGTYGDFVQPMILRKRNKEILKKLSRLDDVDLGAFRHFSESELKHLEALNTKLNNLCQWMNTFVSLYRFIDLESFRFSGSDDLTRQMMMIFSTELIPLAPQEGDDSVSFDYVNFLNKNLDVIKGDFLKKETFDVVLTPEMIEYLRSFFSPEYYDPKEAYGYVPEEEVGTEDQRDSLASDETRASEESAVEAVVSGEGEKNLESKGSEEEEEKVYGVKIPRVLDVSDGQIASVMPFLDREEVPQHFKAYILDFVRKVLAGQENFHLELPCPLFTKPTVDLLKEFSSLFRSNSQRLENEFFSGSGVAVELPSNMTTGGAH